MIIKIDGAVHTPIYEQIYNQVIFAIASESLRAGEQLPSVRQLATDLIINPNTVAKAYRELEREEIVSSQKGVGLFVTDKASGICLKARERIVRKSLSQSLAEAASSGVEKERIKRMIDEGLQDIEEKEE
jgi:GntR family transcriptional regulator